MKFRICNLGVCIATLVACSGSGPKSDVGRLVASESNTDGGSVDDASVVDDAGYAVNDAGREIFDGPAAPPEFDVCASEDAGAELCCYERYLPDGCEGDLHLEVVCLNGAQIKNLAAARCDSIPAEYITFEHFYCCP